MKMKKEEAEYTLSLKKAKMFPKRKRIRKALGKIHDFAFKHARSKTVSIAPEVNEFLHKHSKNIPQKLSIVMQKKEDRVRIFLKGGTQLEETKKKEEQEKKNKEKEKKEKETSEKAKKEEKGTGTGTAEQEKKEEEKKKLSAEKKEKEKAQHAIEMKRKQGRE